LFIWNQFCNKFCGNLFICKLCCNRFCQFVYMKAV
jgi:hypothetical protein